MGFRRKIPAFGKWLAMAGCIFLLSVFLCNAVTGGVARADMGPKPSITVKVVNGPQEYYIALLAHSAFTGSPRDNEEIDNATVWGIIRSYQVDGWQVFWSPLGDNVRFTNRGDKKVTVTFHYMVPNPFRVLLVTPDGKTYVSDELDQKAFNALCTYDVSTGALVEDLSKWEAEQADKGYKVIVGYEYIVACLIVTLLVEFLVLLFFRIPGSKRNLLCFFAANVITNLPYSAYSVLTYQKPEFVLRCIICEIFIAFFEGGVYAILMRDAEGKRNGQNHFTYGVAANFMSALFGMGLLLAYQMLGKLGGSFW